MEQKNEHDIHARIYKFVINVLLLIKKIPESTENRVIKSQITKSVTSIGANDREADGAVTCNDFIHKYSIVRKEGKETKYWLEVIRDTIASQNIEATELINEGEEIIKIVSKIIYNTQKTEKNKKNH